MLIDEFKEQMDILKALANVYFAVYYADLEKEEFVEIKSIPEISKIIEHTNKIDEAFDLFYSVGVHHNDLDKIKAFTNIHTLPVRLSKSDTLSMEYQGTFYQYEYCRATWIPVKRDENGNVKSVVYVVENITEATRLKLEKEKQIEASRREIEENNRIISSAGMGIWHIIYNDYEKPRMIANDTMKKLLDLNYDLNEEEIYDHWYSHIAKESRPIVDNAFKELCEGRKAEITYVWNNPELKERYVRCGGTAEKTDIGYTLRGYQYDVTEEVLKEMQEREQHEQELNKALVEAENANQAKTNFLNNMSHDIRTPMNAVVGFTELLKKHQDEPKKRDDYITKIQDSSQILLSLINNVLEMASIEKGKIQINESAWDAEDFNDSFFHVFIDMMKNKGIIFERNIAVEHTFVYCDPIKLREIFINILSNAYKYTPNGGHVYMDLKEIKGEMDGYAYYQTTISDTGKGMSLEFLPHIFDEFSRENDSSMNRIEGSGLGMPIVKKLVDAMHGTIEVHSKLGEGTTFIVTIPHKIAKEEEIAVESVTEPEEITLKGKRVLLAEDNDLNAEIAIEILRDLGLRVERVANGEECLGKIIMENSYYYDLILMDIQMPVLNGYEATILIRKLDDVIKSKLPIIAMTANAFEEDRKKSLDAGMDDHLAKPINVPELERVLGKYLRR